MKQYILLIIALTMLTSHKVFGQPQLLSEQIDSLNQILDIPFDNCKVRWHDCGDELIWRIVQQEKSAIEPLIKKMADTSFTNIYFKDRSETLRLRTGDIAYITLKQILYLPTYILTSIEFDVVVCGGYQSGFFNYLNDFSNRRKFQKQVEEYYHNGKFTWVPYDKIEITHCAISHNINGRFEKEE